MAFPSAGVESAVKKLRVDEQPDLEMCQLHATMHEMETMESAQAWPAPGALGTLWWPCRITSEQTLLWHALGRPIVHAQLM